MVEERFQSKQRPSRYFSVNQKREIIPAYQERSRIKPQIWQEFIGGTN